MLQGELNFWLSLIFGGVFIYLLARVMLRPARVLLQIFIRVVIGAVCLLILNTALGFLLDFQIAINFITALAVGCLGLPGIFLLIATLLLIGG